MSVSLVKDYVPSEIVEILAADVKIGHQLHVGLGRFELVSNVMIDGNPNKAFTYMEIECGDRAEAWNTHESVLVKRHV